MAIKPINAVTIQLKDQSTLNWGGSLVKQRYPPIFPT